MSMRQFLPRHTPFRKMLSCMTTSRLICTWTQIVSSKSCQLDACTRIVKFSQRWNLGRWNGTWKNSGSSCPHSEPCQRKASRTPASRACSIYSSLVACLIPFTSLVRKHTRYRSTSMRDGQGISSVYTNTDKFGTDSFHPVSYEMVYPVYVL